MRFPIPILIVAITVAICAAPPATAEKGRAYEEGRRLRLSISIGDRTPISGSVVETSRPINELRENPDPPESFTFEELGLTESDTTYGLSLEYQWKWVTLFVDATYLEASVTAEAPRDLFIGVEKVSFGGQEYEYQVIPRGLAYTGDMDLLALNIRGAFTPVTVNPGGTTEFVPWVLLGLFNLGGRIDLDAGPATGIEQYENPPRTYVRGGKSEGEAAAFAPEIGLGGEIKFRLSERARLGFIGNYSIFKFKGSTGDLGVSSRREKDVDADYAAIDAKVFYEMPLGSGTNLVIGLAYRQVEIDASSKATPKSEEEILELREKFDKDITLEVETVLFSVGVRW